MIVFKFRAECVHDVEQAAKALNVNMQIVERYAGLPDVVAEFHSPRTLDFIRGALSTIVDGHVMLETVQPKALYTGDRKAL